MPVCGRPFVKRFALCYWTVFCPVCNVGILWPHCVRWGLSSAQKGHSAPLLGQCLLWPNGWMDQNATWCVGRPWGPSCSKVIIREAMTGIQCLCPAVALASDLLLFPPPQKKGSTATPCFLAHVYCGQTVTHLSYC